MLKAVEPAQCCSIDRCVNTDVPEYRKPSMYVGADLLLQKFLKDPGIQYRCETVFIVMRRSCRHFKNLSRSDKHY